MSDLKDLIDQFPDFTIYNPVTYTHPQTDWWKPEVYYATGGPNFSVTTN